MFKILVAITLMLSQSIDATENPWATMARIDLEAIHSTLQENHPGAIDSENPWFKKQLEEGYKEGLNEIDKVHSYNDYEYLLSRYVSNFKDGHLSIYYSLSRKYVPFTGFLLSFQGNKFLIAESNNKKIPIGAELENCDGLLPKEIMLRDVFPVRRGNPDIDSSWETFAPFLLQSVVSAWSKPYKKCVFKFKKQTINEYVVYENIPEAELIKKINTLRFSKERAFSQSKLSKNIILIRIPHFEPEGKQLQDLQKIVKGISKLRKNKFIVFDLRGNGGGNSMWGYELMAGVFGKSFVDKSLRSYDKNTYVEWRVSDGNLDHVKNGILPRIERQFGKESEGYKEFNMILSSLEKAKTEKKDFARQDSSETFEQIKNPGDSKELSNARVVLLTDGFCASACLDFMDIALKMPNTVHMGTSTDADTLYMDIRGEKLPSTLAHLNFAVKVYRHRLRGHNVAYKPSIMFNGSIADTHAVKNWVIEELAHLK